MERCTAEGDSAPLLGVDPPLLGVDPPLLGVEPPLLGVLKSHGFRPPFFFGEDHYVPMGITDIGVGNRRGQHAYENTFRPGIGIIRDRDEIFLQLRYTF